MLPPVIPQLLFPLADVFYSTQLLLVAAADPAMEDESSCCDNLSTLGQRRAISARSKVTLIVDSHRRLQVSWNGIEEWMIHCREDETSVIKLSRAVTAAADLF